MEVVKYIENGLNVEYYSSFYNAFECEAFWLDLETLPYLKPLQFNIHGKDVSTRRKVCAFGDVNYIFSGQDVQSHAWYDYVKEIKTDVEKLLGCTFNHALINYYPDGNSKISPHKDNEACLDPTSPIAVVSFGATRTLQFMRPGYTTVNILVDHGSLYVMYPPTNQLFTHGIPAEPEVQTARYSITFRHVITDEPPAKKMKMDLLSDLITQTLTTDIPTVSMNITPPMDITTDMPLRMDDVIPSNDWLDRYLQIPCKKEICNWNLGWSTHVTVVADQKSVRIHIREYNENKHGERFATKKGVMMTPATWSELCMKLQHFDMHRKDSSTILNNQMALFCMDDDSYQLQQIFKNENVFTFKQAYLKLYIDQLERIVENAMSITHCIEEYMFTHLLAKPILTRVCRESDHISEEESLKYYIDCFKSQYQDLFTRLGSNYETASKSRIFFNINMPMLVQKLCFRQCICHYTDQFFQVNCIDMLYKEVFQ